MASRTVRLSEEERLLTPQELADYLGVPLATVYGWRYRGNGPPGVRIGRHLRYRWSDIQGWLTAQTSNRGGQMSGANWVVDKGIDSARRRR